MENTNKIASSGTVEGLAESLNKFFYSTKYEINLCGDGSYDIYHPDKGFIRDLFVSKRKRRGQTVFYLMQYEER